MIAHTLLCPKCNTKNLRVIPYNLAKIEIGQEVFCAHCRLYFGWVELKEYWNIDIGDFYDIDSVSEPEFENFDKYLCGQFGFKYTLSEDFWDTFMDNQDPRLDIPYPIDAVGSS